jgi:ATP-dependent Clp protease protease subunit
MPKNLLDFKGVQSGSPLRVFNKSATEAEVVIYAGIGQDYWGDGSMISAKTFNDELKKLPDTIKSLNIRINSPGGDVFDGISIYNLILAWKKKSTGRDVKVHIDGWAASIASVIALAGDEVIMGEGALFMIHLPWTFTGGNRMAFENTINRLSTIEDQMLGIYSKKSGLSRTEIQAMLEEEVWFSADEAIENGFVDSKAEETMAIAASAVKSPWLNKRPDKYVSEADVTKQKIEQLKNKISRLTRK